MFSLFSLFFSLSSLEKGEQKRENEMHFIFSALSLPGVAIHCYSYKDVGLKVENAGHFTTNHRYLFADTDKPIKPAEYNSFVFLTLKLGQWGDDVSWTNAERASTDVLLKHPGYINSRAGGAGGNETTCGASIEFLIPTVRTLWSPNFKPTNVLIGKPW